MGYPTNSELTSAIVKESFYDEVELSLVDRVFTKISMEIPQSQQSTDYVSFGSVPEPTQLSGLTGTGGTKAKELKDYKLTVNLKEWDDTVNMPRSVVDDNPAEAGRIARTLGQKATVFFDKEAITQLDSADLGYDGDALYSTTHGESGTDQINTFTDAAATGTIPTLAELQPELEDNIAVLLAFTDDQGTPVNEATKRYTILIPPTYMIIYNLLLNPNLTALAADVTGGSGSLRGMFDVVVSGYCPGDRHFVFANHRGNQALGYMSKIPWEITSNIGTDSDAWRYGREAIFTGYARFTFAPWDWKRTVRQIWS